MRPFTGRNMTEIALQVMNQPPPDLGTIDPDSAAARWSPRRTRPGQAAARIASQSAGDMAAALGQALGARRHDRDGSDRCAGREDAPPSPRRRSARSNANWRSMSVRSRTIWCRPRRGMPGRSRNCATSLRDGSISRSSAPGSARYDRRCQRPVGAPRPAGAGAAGRTRTRGLCRADRAHPGKARYGDCHIRRRLLAAAGLAYRARGGPAGIPEQATLTAARFSVDDPIALRHCVDLAAHAASRLFRLGPYFGGSSCSISARPSIASP